MSTLPTFSSARDEVLELIKGALDSHGVTPRDPVLCHWPGVEGWTNPSPSSIWCRVSIREFTSDQRTLAPPGDRRFQRTGIVTVQIFAPVSLAPKDWRDLAEGIRGALEGKGTDSGIFFRSTNISELGREPGGWYQVNVTARFDYHACG